MENALNLLKQYNIDKNTPLIISVSGGVDSMVLLNILATNKYKAIVVHFNHQTRKENDLEEQLVRETAKNYNLGFHVFKFEQASGNFHEQARNFRIKKLEEIAIKYKTSYILTAHHLDDLAETVLMKITRGSNLYGYAGIHEYVKINDFIFMRPLLSYSKKEIIAYATKEKINYLDDSSNFELHYTRNRIRHTVLPILKQENPQVLNKFKDFQNSLTESYNFIRKYTSKFIDSNNKINTKTLINEDLLIKREAIVMLLEKHQITFNKQTLDNLLNLIDSVRPNLTYNLSNNYHFVKSYDYIYITNKSLKEPFEVVLDKKVNLLPNMKKITFLTNLSHNSKFNHKICYNNISLPLIARTRINGDVLMFSYGKKKLKDYLIDLKIPLTKRNELIVLTDSNNTILWVENIYNNQTLGNKNELYFEIGEHTND